MQHEMGRGEGRGIRPHLVVGPRGRDEQCRAQCPHDFGRKRRVIRWLVDLDIEWNHPENGRRRWPSSR